MDWKPITKKDTNSVIIPERWLHVHYYEALNILFRMENSLRVFVYLILKNKFRDKWQDTNVQISEGQSSSISSAVTAKISQAKGFGYLGYEINSPLMYLNSGELTRLITSDSYWDIFKPYFKAKKDVIKNKFEEIAIVRNSLAHFRPLKIDDVELIKQNIKHAFIGIEECLNEVTDIYNIVPTNTPDEWYKTLSNLSSDLYSINLHQSKNRKWIRLNIEYLSPIIEERIMSTFRSYKVLNLLSPAIVALDEFSSLTKACTFVTETKPYGTIQENEETFFGKNVRIVFNKDVLSSEYLKISEQIKTLLEKITEESNLIKNDNLAQGNLIESVNVYASLRSKEDPKYWTFITGAMECPFGENDPPEYWGNIALYNSDFIAGSHKYPWMPSDVSSEESPF